MEVSKEAFFRYVVVQAMGVCNMWSKEVETLGNLTEEEHLYIIQHYSELVDVYDIHVDDIARELAKTE